MSLSLAISSFAARLLIFLSAQNAIAVSPASPTNGDHVVLVHGMGRTAFSMKLMERNLAKRGFDVVNVTYRAGELSVEQLAQKYLNALLERKVMDDGRKVHFVTHSLGGIIVRQYLSNHRIKNLGRVVMLAPPNHGSEVIDCLRANCITRNFLGVAARELGTGHDCLTAKLGPIHFECGVIAGDCSLNPLSSSLLPGPNDGKVTIASTRVEGMQDFLIVHGTHTWLMCKHSVMDQTARFLQSGHFNKQNW
jgi:triacylglycerol lipase